MDTEVVEKMVHRRLLASLAQPDDQSDQAWVDNVERLCAELLAVAPEQVALTLATAVRSLMVIQQLLLQLVVASGSVSHEQITAAASQLLSDMRAEAPSGVVVSATRSA